MKIQHTFSLFFVPLVIAPLLLLGWNSYVYLYDSSQSKAYATMNSVLGQLKLHIDSEYDQAKSNLSFLETDLVLRNYVMVEDEMTRYSIYQIAVLERFQNFRQAYPQYEEIRLVLRDGFEDAYLSSADVNNLTDEEGESPWFRELFESEADYYHRTTYSLDSADYVTYFFKPMYIRNAAVYASSAVPEFRGFLGLTLNLDGIRAHLQHTTDLNDYRYILFSPEGHIISQSADIIAATLEELKVLFDPVSNPQGEVTEEIIPVGSGDYYAGRRDVMQGSVLVTVSPTSPILQYARKLSINVIELTLITIVITVFSLIYLLRKIVVSPLDKLAEASKQIGVGNLETHIQVSGSDEFQSLASNFNRMSDQLIESSKKMRFIANHDRLTQLPNRRMFQYFLNNSLATARRRGEHLALLFLDIDDFKVINDSLGHDVGDELLKIVAGRVSSSLRGEDYVGAPDNGDQEHLVARLGGDEFTLVLPRLDSAKDASVVAERIIHSMKTPFRLGGRDHNISTSIGITVYPEDADTPEGLLKCADIAMYHAKSKGKNNYQYFTAQLNEEIANRLERERELRKAITEGELVLHYQPQIDLRTHKICGVESLVRWNHPVKGMILPYQFISLAEETGMILELGLWVLNESCRQAKVWMDKGLLDFRVSFNVSSVQFRGQNIVSLIEESLSAHSLPPESLTVELTETALMSDDGEGNGKEILQSIRALGVDIALDDFGTGYSSLSYLRAFPVNYLKIDRSFIVEAEQKEDVKCIVRAIVQMAKSLSLKVVAEGVENIDQLNLLESMDCDVIQGFYFSKPLPAEKLEQFALAWKGNRDEGRKILSPVSRV